MKPTLITLSTNFVTNTFPHSPSRDFELQFVHSHRQYDCLRKYRRSCLLVSPRCCNRVVTTYMLVFGVIYEVIEQTTSKLNLQVSPSNSRLGLPIFTNKSNLPRLSNLELNWAAGLAKLTHVGVRARATIRGPGERDRGSKRARAREREQQSEGRESETGRAIKRARATERGQQSEGNRARATEREQQSERSNYKPAYNFWYQKDSKRYQKNQRIRKTRTVQRILNLTFEKNMLSLFVADVDLYVDENLTIYCRRHLSLRWGKRGRRQI